MRVRIFLKYGHTMDVSCTDYNFTKDNHTGEYLGYRFEGVPTGQQRGACGMNPRDIVGWQVK